MRRRTEGGQVILAIAALLLHVPAVPQSALPNISPVAPVMEGAATRAPAGGEPVSGESSAVSQPASPVVQSTRLADRPAPAIVAAFEPGRLTPIPVEPASADPAAGAPAAPPSSTAGAGLIAYSPAEVRNREQRRKRLWLGLGIAQSSAAAFDAWSTRRVISSGDGQELNPMLRPFAGNASLYAAIQVTPVLLDYLSRRMMNSRHQWERRTWWMPQGLGTAMSLASGVHNLGVHH
jgi:hypothetical protein